MIKERARERNSRTWTVNIVNRQTLGAEEKDRSAKLHVRAAGRPDDVHGTVRSRYQVRSGNRRTRARYRLRKTSVHALTTFPSSHVFAVFVDTRQVRDRSGSCAFNPYPDLTAIKFMRPDSNVYREIARYLNHISQDTSQIETILR